MDPLPFAPEAFGITRLAEQGTLVPTGVPVWCAVRPAARSFVVANGKGRTHAQARLSAAMEAVECACAEASERLIMQWANLVELQAEGAPVLDFEKVLSVRDPNLEPSRQRGWVRGVELIDGAEVLAPYEVVGLDYRLGAGWDRGSIRMSSGGLAAHIDAKAATLHALQELIEQEARLFLTSIPGYARHRPRLDPSEVLPSHCDDLLRELSDGDGWVELIDATTDIGVPVVMAILHEARTGAALKRHAAGCACRMNLTKAAEAAVLEAVQSRVTDFAGARDDIVPDDYAPRDTRAGPPDRFVPPREGLDCTDPLATLISRLARVGLSRMFCFDLSPPNQNVVCQKLLVPGLECVVDSAGMPRRGPRFTARAIQNMLP